MKFGTKTIHAGQHADPTTGAIMTPIYQTSTYIQNKPGDHKGYEYSRTANPTRSALEKNIAELENGKYGLCFGSGLAAVDCIIKLLKPGDEVISTNDLYGGTYRIFTKVFEELGIKFHFTGMRNSEQVTSLVNSKTKMIWTETPTNPMLNIIDIKALGKISKKNNLLLVVDNTFATPFLQTPLDLGADIVMHSLTKYMGGHSDVIMGAAICKDEKIAELSLVENIQRSDLNPIEEAEGYQSLLDKYNYTQEEISIAVGKSRSYIGNITRLLLLSDKAKKLLLQNKLTIGHVRPLIGHKDIDIYLDIILKNRLNSRDIEKLIKNGNSKAHKLKIINVDVLNLEKELSEITGLGVKVDFDSLKQTGMIKLKCKIPQLNFIFWIGNFSGAFLDIMPAD